MSQQSGIGFDNITLVQLYRAKIEGLVRENEKKDAVIAEQGLKINDLVEKKLKRIDKLDAALSKISDLEKELSQVAGSAAPTSALPQGLKQGVLRDGGQEHDGQGGSGRTPGGQVGHSGVTNRPNPSRFVGYKRSKCPGCGECNLKMKRTESRDVTEMPPSPTPVTIRHTAEIYDCSDCGLKDIVPDGWPTDSAGDGSGEDAGAREVGNGLLS